MRSITYWRGKGVGYKIDATHSGDGLNTNVKAIVQNDMIICDFSVLGATEYITIKTPFPFEVIDAWLVVGNGENVASKTLTLKNGSTALSSTLSMATDKGLVRATTLDEDQAKFKKDDDDLKLVSSNHTDGGGTVYIKFR